MNIREMKIEDYEWKMRTIVHVENNQAVYDAVGEEITTHPEVKIIDMTLVAKDGGITITDITNSKTYYGTYKAVQKTPAGTDYEVTIDGNQYRIGTRGYRYDPLCPLREQFRTMFLPFHYDKRHHNQNHIFPECRPIGYHQGITKATAI